MHGSIVDVDAFNLYLSCVCTARLEVGEPVCSAIFYLLFRAFSPVPGCCLYRLVRFVVPRKPADVETSFFAGGKPVVKKPVPFCCLPRILFPRSCYSRHGRFFVCFVPREGL